LDVGVNICNDRGAGSRIGSVQERECIKMESLKEEFEYYIEHQDELVRKYNGKFIVIKGGKVIGEYGSPLEAVEETSKKYELGTFLVQKCEPGSESYTQTYHSRVSFV
jgi:hypothetical protein